MDHRRAYCSAEHLDFQLGKVIVSDDLNEKLILDIPLCGATPMGVTASSRFVNHNVAISENYASFNGTDSYIEFTASQALQLGDGDFSIAAQIWTAKELDGVVGDIVSKFDPTHRRGLNLSVKNHAGAVTSQTNFRNLHFEVDDATEAEWRDYGRPGNAVAIWALANHHGQLFAGTYEQGSHEVGGVFR